MQTVVTILWEYNYKEVKKMTDNEILEKLKEIIVNQLNVDEDLIKEEASFIDDLSADSLDIVELIMSLEESFDISVPDTEVEKLVTVGDLVKYIKNNK
jgi:acyl carrier protein